MTVQLLLYRSEVEETWALKLYRKVRWNGVQLVLPETMKLSSTREGTRDASNVKSIAAMSEIP